MKNQNQRQIAEDDKRDKHIKHRREMPANQREKRSQKSQGNSKSQAKNLNSNQQHPVDKWAGNDLRQSRHLNYQGKGQNHAEISDPCGLFHETNLSSNTKLANNNADPGLHQKP